MGICCSKKKPPAEPGKVAAAVSKSDDKARKPAARQAAKRAAAGEAHAAATKPAAVFVARPKDGPTAPGGGEEKNKKKRPGSQSQEPAPKQLPVVVVPSAPVRTSSCTKEEVDAILIQCGRLSRSSSGAGRAASSGETGPGGGAHRRRRSSGSKRSYDFDQAGGGADEAGEERGDWERQGVSSTRPSPCRGSPQRKRSGSRERSGGGGGSRRASRSPGRRGDAAAAATSGGGGDRARQQQQPGKMVSVPAREKGRAPSPSPAAAAASGKRCASPTPRSSSPARMAAAGNENASGGGGPAAGPTPVALSRSSSRKNEQSPYRRNPMAEIDENALRNNSSSSHGARPQKKSTETAVATTPRKATGRGKEPSGKEKPEIAVDAETRAHSSKTTTTTRTASIAAESLTQRPAAGSRSRRASRDFDQNPGSYTTQLLEDIHSYHQQSTAATPATTPSLSLPACVAKACSIVEAVADLNSSSSESRTCEYEPGRHSADDKGSVNAPAGSGIDSFVEPSAAARKHHHLLPPRAETEPQESAGSNSVSGHPWTPSWEPTSVESSTDQTWSAGDEVVEQSGSHGGGGRSSPVNRLPRQSKQRQCQPEPSGRSRAGSGNGNGGQYRGRSAHRAGGGGGSSVASGRSGARVVSANS